MKTKFLLALVGFIFISTKGEAQIPEGIHMLKAGETTVAKGAYVLSAQEQLTGQAFQQDALTSYKGYQYTVYYNGTRNVCIARRKLPLGEWKEAVLPHKNTTDDSHNVISMGICYNDGTIHLSYDHHNTTLRYCRSVLGLANEPENFNWTSADFGSTTSQMEAGVTVPDVTYPRFINKPDGNLLFECRYKLSGDGDSYLREYDGTTHTWSLVGRYVQGMDFTPDACAYINRIDYDKSGKLHVSWCWRDDFGGGSNHDISYAYSEDHGRTWKDTKGNSVAQTEKINPTDSRASGICLRQGISSLKVVTIPYNKGYINQESQATDSKGRVHVLNSHIPLDEGTDGNWESSRKKSRLHQRFRDTNGTWVTNQVKNNGVTVNSYCRSQIVIDAFDNAYVIANGAEVYAATDAGNYANWGLVSNADKGRFCSEPQVDQKRIFEGVLSFVYLGRDKKIVVIDYLLDNPLTPKGTGLNATFFSDAKMQEVIETQTDVAVGQAEVPQGAQYVRYSGCFETMFAEPYTLSLKTSKPAVVSVNGVCVLKTGNISEETEFPFTFQSIASHKNNITIETESSSSLSLFWSGERTPKDIIPTTNLYTETVEIYVVLPPTLEVKETLPDLLQDAITTVSAASGSKKIYQLPLNPPADYSLEISATVSAATGRGLEMEVRNGGARGFRTAMNTTNLQWYAPFSSPELICTTSSQKQVIRYAVKGDEVHMYQNGNFIQTTSLTSIGDMNASGTVENAVAAKVIGVESAENIISNGNFKGITHGAAPTGWSSEKTMGGGTQSRVQIKENTTELTNMPDGTAAFVFRFDNDSQYGTWYSYPVQLKPSGWYEYSFDVIAWGTNTSKTFNAIISTSSNGSTGIIAQQAVKTAATGKTVERHTVRFQTPASANATDTYYLTFGKAESMGSVGATNLTLTENNVGGILFGKNYTSGSMTFSIDYIRYDSEGAFAPKVIETGIKKETISKEEIQIYPASHSIYLNNLPAMANIYLYDISGRCIARKISAGDQDIISGINPGIYIVSVAFDNQTFKKKVIVNK